jgi:hypothetical protein
LLIETPLRGKTNKNQTLLKEQREIGALRLISFFFTFFGLKQYQNFLKEIQKTF